MAILYQQESYDIIGAAMAVHRELGEGFLEEIYQEAREIEFNERCILYEREKLIQISYKGNNLKKFYKADFFCYGNIIVELKAVTELNGEHKSQVINYLKATGCRLGLLINFGAESLQYERLVRLK